MHEVSVDTLTRRGIVIAGSREQHFTVPEIAADWGLSENTVRRLFINEDGVIKVMSPRAMLVKNPKRKPNVSLRISAGARDRVYAGLAAGLLSKLKATSRRVE